MLAVTILSTGIASVTAMWTVVKQVILQPLPVRDQDGVVVAWSDERVRKVPHFPSLVGVAKDTRCGELTDQCPTVYFPLRQVSTFHSNYSLVRTTGAGPPIMRVVREALAANGSGFHPNSAVSVKSRLAEPLARPRFSALLLSIFAGIALLLATSGVYGIMAFLVRSRRREIGIRLACGATPIRAGARVLGQGVFIALAGAGGGLAAALASARALRSVLFGVTPSDPISLGVAVGISLAMAAGACWLPARRAARVDRGVVLRGDQRAGRIRACSPIGEHARGLVPSSSPGNPSPARAPTPTQSAAAINRNGVDPRAQDQ